MTCSVVYGSRLPSLQNMQSGSVYPGFVASSIDPAAKPLFAPLKVWVIESIREDRLADTISGAEILTILRSVLTEKSVNRQ